MSEGTHPEAGLVFVAALWSARLVGGFVVLCTLLPFIRTGWWVARVCDFPRLQLAFLCLLVALVFVGFALRHGWRTDSVVSVAVLSLVLLWQSWHIVKYTPLWPTTVPSSDASNLRLLVTNLDYENSRYEEVRDVMTKVNPDILLLIETDERWEHQLADVKRRFAHHVGESRPNGLGIALWSKRPLVDPRIEYRVSDDRPSTRATVDIADARVQFVGVHPTPPGLSKRGPEGRHDSRVRDAELVLIARDVAADPDSTWVVAGDFNDVAWSHTTRLFQRLSGLRDPRVGRGMYSTYHAEYPLLRYPLDHVFVSSGVRVSHLDRIAIPGSDHFAMLAELDLANSGPGVLPTADPQDRREATQMINEGVKDAAESGDSTQ